MPYRGKAPICISMKTLTSARSSRSATKPVTEGSNKTPRQRLHSVPVGVVEVNVRSDGLDSVGGLHPDGSVYTVLYLLLGQEGLILLPALDALEQGAAHVPVGTACGQAGIQVNVRLDDGGQGQLAAAVYHLFAGEGFEVRSDLFKLTVGHTDINRFGCVFDEQILKKHGFHSYL